MCRYKYRYTYKYTQRLLTPLTPLPLLHVFPPSGKKAQGSGATTRNTWTEHETAYSIIHSFPLRNFKQNLAINTFTRHSGTHTERSDEKNRSHFLSHTILWKVSTTNRFVIVSALEFELCNCPIVFSLCSFFFFALFESVIFFSVLSSLTFFPRVLLDETLQRGIIVCTWFRNVSRLHSRLRSSIFLQDSRRYSRRSIAKFDSTLEPRHLGSAQRKLELFGEGNSIDSFLFAIHFHLRLATLESSSQKDSEAILLGFQASFDVDEPFVRLLVPCAHFLCVAAFNPAEHKILYSWKRSTQS